MSDTPYADQFVNFQALLDKVGPAYRELHNRSLPHNIDDLRENWHKATMDVLKEYNRVLTELQKQKDFSMEKTVKEYSDSLSSNYDPPKVYNTVRIEDIRAAERKQKSDLAIKAEQRPENFEQLDAETQWMIDKELGILDWDGS